MNDRDKRVIKWFCSGDSGISSETLCACFYGIPQKYKGINYPGDPGDFGRCKRFLDLLSPEEKKTVLQAAAKISPEWKLLVEKWDNLEWMHDHVSNEALYDEMQKILNKVRQ